MLAKIAIVLVLLPYSGAVRFVQEPGDWDYVDGIDFIACSEPQPCGPGATSRYSSRYMGDLVESADKRVRAANHTPVVLHIGGGGFRPGKWIGSGLYNAVRATGPVQFWLVEASVELTALSRRNLKLLNFKGTADILNAFTLDDCTDKHLYQLDQERIKDFGIDWIWNWETTDRVELMDIIKYQPDDVVGSMTHPPLPLDYNERFRSLANAANLSDYIVSTPLTSCLTPAKLLEKLNVKPEELAMVVTDIEGADLAVMNAFLDMPEFRPDYIQFEWQLNALDELSLLVKKLQKHGYSVGKSDMSDPGERNIVCVPSTAG